ncbi:MAG: hypothetical protein ABL958_13395, partial [Bdellovibrionia bacterium]
LFLMSVIQFYLLYRDGLFFDLATWKNYFPFMFGRGGFARRLLSEMFHFARGDFHPSQVHQIPG